MAALPTTFPAIYVINLDHRTDRWDDFVSNWSPLLDFSTVQRIPAVYGKKLSGFGERPWFTQNTKSRENSWAGVAGCLLSHRKVIETAQKAGHDFILVLEDDAAPSPELLKYLADGRNNPLNEIPRHLSALPRWGICYPGYTKTPKAGVPVAQIGQGPELWQVPGVLTTHSYILNKSCFTPLLAHLPTEEIIWDWIARNRAIDTWLKEQFEWVTGRDVLISLPQLVIQSVSYSDLLQTESAPAPDLGEKPAALSPKSYRLKRRFLGPFQRLKIRMGRLLKYLRIRMKGFPGASKTGKTN